MLSIQKNQDQAAVISNKRNLTLFNQFSYIPYTLSLVSSVNKTKYGSFYQTGSESVVQMILPNWFRVSGSMLKTCFELLNDLDFRLKLLYTPKILNFFI